LCNQHEKLLAEDQIGSGIRKIPVRILALPLLLSMSFNRFVEIKLDDACYVFHTLSGNINHLFFFFPGEDTDD